MLDDLLTIKRRREEDAAAAVVEAQRIVGERHADRQARKAALYEYVVWQEDEKERLYAQVYRKSVSRAKLEGYREQIGMLRQRHLQMEEDLEKAECELRAAEAELEKARRKRLEAYRQVVKFEEYQSVLEAEKKRAAERREETEAEDIATPRQGSLEADFRPRGSRPR